MDDERRMCRMRRGVVKRGADSDADSEKRVVPSIMQAVLKKAYQSATQKNSCIDVEILSIDKCHAGRGRTLGSPADDS